MHYVDKQVVHINTLFLHRQMCAVYTSARAVCTILQIRVWVFASKPDLVAHWEFRVSSPAVCRKRSIVNSEIWSTYRAFSISSYNVLFFKFDDRLLSVLHGLMCRPDGVYLYALCGWMCCIITSNQFHILLLPSSYNDFAPRPTARSQSIVDDGLKQYGRN